MILLELLDSFLQVGDVYEKYGIKGCLLIVLAVAAVIGAVVVLVLWLG